MSKRDFGSIKSLLHFDFPYYNEPHDGLDDEVRGAVWTREGNTKLAGVKIPYEYEGSPKFGYRCAYFPDNTSYIDTTNTNGEFDIKPAGSYEFECFVKAGGTASAIDYEAQGYKFFNGHTYKYYNDPKTWHEAKAACEALGGHLATSTSAEKNTFLTTLTTNLLWLGGTDEETEGVWKWITGETWDYTNWGGNEPDNGTSENYLAFNFYTVSKKWSNAPSTGPYGYICEWDYDMRSGTISDGDILNLDNELALSIESGALQLTSTSWGIEETSQTTLTADTWQHVLLRLSGGTAKVYLDGTEALSASITGNAIEPETVRLGGYYGFMDEFVFRDEAGTDAPTIPTHPYNGTLDIAKVGGYGTGLDGDAEIRIISQINSYGLINSITDSKTFTVSSWSNGDLLPSDGCEIMLHITAPKSETSAEYPLVGLYAFSKIASVIGTSIILEDEITTGNGYDFTLSSSLLSTYYVQVITVPNYKNLTINSGITVNPLTWSTTTGGGIVAFRCTGDCEVNGSIITHGYGAVRYDLQQMTNSKLIDRFLCGSRGGGIFITCGGTFTATSTARLGASWSGASEGGIPATGAAGGHGGAGYGGAGGGDIDDSGTGGYGGVGGGGGGGNDATGGNAGTSGTGGYGLGISTNCDGGTQGITAGGNSANGYNCGGGAGAGGLSWQTTYGGCPGSNAGASIILIADTLNVDTAAISTGGEGGNSNNEATGGSGTGFCYIAYREQVN